MIRGTKKQHIKQQVGISGVTHATTLTDKDAGSRKFLLRLFVGLQNCGPLVACVEPFENVFDSFLKGCVS